LVELVGIGKTFSGLPVLAGVNLEIEAGTVHTIVGENGAGKSTLGKIVGGVHRPDSGIMRVDGVDVSFKTPAEALELGIAVMQQEIALAPDLTVIENTLLGREPCKFGFVNKPECLRRFGELLDMTQFDLPAHARVADLSLAQQQQVEILRALARDARVIVMDEPTAALPVSAVEHLHRVIRMLTDRGVAIVYVSHFLEETLALSDTVTVLRNGRLVATKPAATWTIASMITAMLGQSLEASYPILAKVADDAPIRLAITDLADGNRLRGASLDVRVGEIIGLFGLVGSGRSELAHAIFGASASVAGDIRIDGEAFKPRQPSEAMSRGVALLPESRKDQGLFLGHSKRDNGSLNGLAKNSKAGFVDQGRETSSVSALLERCTVDISNLDVAVGTLSGGNQQKVLLAKTLYTDPRILILDEPTRGVDIGARRSIYDTIAQQVDKGLSVILISSDIDEVQKMSHRLYVLRDGKTAGEFVSTETSHTEVLNAAFGI